MVPTLHKEFLDIQANYIVLIYSEPCNMIITYSQIHHTAKYSQLSSIIWPVWLNGWVFVYELSGCGFESHCSHLLFIWVSPLKILKWYCNVFRTRSLPSTACYNHLEKQGNFASLVALIFPQNLMCYYLIFHLLNYLITLIKKIIGRSH